MTINVQLPEALVETAKYHGRIERRSVPEQIECWSRIGRIAAQNPNLSFRVIRGLLLADQEEQASEYRPG